MEKLKKLCTLILWYIMSPIWEMSVKSREQITVPDEFEIHTYFRNLLSAINVLGPSLARKFDGQVKNRLLMILYWAAKNKKMSLDLRKPASKIMTEINAVRPDGLTIRYQENSPYQFEYWINNSWKTQKFPDGTIWNKELSKENESLAYLVNVVLNWKED